MKGPDDPVGMTIQSVCSRSDDFLRHRFLDAPPPPKFCIFHFYLMHLCVSRLVVLLLVYLGDKHLRKARQIYREA